MKMELREWINENVVIFPHDCENNTIKKTVEEAVKQGVSFAWANLSGAKCDESQKDIILKAIGLVFHKWNDSK